MANASWTSTLRQIKETDREIRELFAKIGINFMMEENKE